ncbi:h domain protein [Antrihabitans cavernicola]|uniref:H domain protein n=1 Tax=Antrihabitans cavernicola TaxID=2495913 RepID=A0A5A7SB63_9NOCA|nr:h domain protein [Spelaeibacter cavernicola]
MALAAAVVLALLIAAILLGYQYWSDKQTEDARVDAVDAAGRQSVAMLSYDFNTVDAELPKAEDGLTGDFKDQYKTLIDQAIIPGAKEKQLTVKVTVQGGSVVSASRDKVTTLLFLNQATTSKDTPQAVISGSRVRVDLEKHDGRWLVSSLTPV